MRVRTKADFRSLIRDGRIHQGLTPSTDYYVVGVDEETFRVINDKAEPIIYPKEFFEVVDSAIPAGWQFKEFSDGEYRLGPIVASAPGFYEDFFFSDGDVEAYARTRATLRKVLELAMRSGSKEDAKIIRRDLARWKT